MTEKATRKAIRAALRALAKVSMAAAPSSKNQLGSNEFFRLSEYLDVARRGLLDALEYVSRTDKYR